MLTIENINTSSAILAFDASGLTCSAAVIKDGRVLSSVYSNNGLTHSKTLLPVIERVLFDARTSIKDIDAIALTVGPGSFTGVKIGVATAKGLAFANGIPCLAVSSMAALACGAKGLDGVICPVSDARRGMFYNALFRCERSCVTRLCSDRQISTEELLNELLQYVKNDEKIILLGDGAELFVEKTKDENIEFYRLPQNSGFIHSEGIYEAIKEGLFEEKSDSELTAVYLRPPQAERERLERLAAEQKEKQEETKVRK